MNSIAAYFAENNGPNYLTEIGPENIDRIKQWYSKWAHNDTIDRAVSLLRWIYAHEDFDLMPPSLFQEHIKLIESEYGVPTNDALSCLLEGKKLIWNV